MRFNSDVDIDFADRSKLLEVIEHVPAAMRNVEPVRKHSTGIHVTAIPYDPEYDMATLDYTDAEDRGYLKLDLLNVYVYQWVRDEPHLYELMKEPNWDSLLDYENFKHLIHLSNHWRTMKAMPEPINSIPRLAMFLAVIRPAKRHLVGKTWAEVSKTIWDKDGAEYAFKKSHAVAYAHLVVVHMNLLAEGLGKTLDQSDTLPF